MRLAEWLHQSSSSAFARLEDVLSGFRATAGTTLPVNSFTHQDDSVTIESDDTEIESLNLTKFVNDEDRDT